MKINLLLEKIERNHHIIMLIILMMMLLAPLTYSMAQPCNLALTETHTNVTCNGAMDGSITLSANVSSGSLDFLWSDGSTDQNRSGLAPGTYIVNASDGEYCADSLTITITEAPEFIIYESHIAAICASNLNSVIVTQTGGIPPYTYLWNDGNTDDHRDQLGVGTYTVTVTDANGCIKQLSISFSNSQFQCSLSKPTIISCSNSCDGSLKANTPAGGVYYYLWSNGATTKMISNLCAATYTVTITNGLGCTRQLSTHICGPKKITPTGILTQISSIGANDGTITWTTTGGNPPYSYLWNDGYTTGNRTNIAPGNYTINITDTKGCTAISKKQWKNPVPRMGSFDESLEVVVAPNPATDNFDIEMNSKVNSVCTIEILDVDGRFVFSRKFDLAEGFQKLNIDMSKNSKGVYTVCVSNPERRFVKKLVLL